MEFPVEKLIGLCADIRRKIVGAVWVQDDKIAPSKPFLHRDHAVIYAGDFEIIIVERRVDENCARGDGA